ncbi:MAG: helix-turn-helix domain-containing protein [Planctomycetota bacterium]|jgi:DNA-binding XRE family transcriptional regulator
MEGFARDIRKIRVELGWTQTEFAELLGVKRLAVARWETGVMMCMYPELVLEKARTLPKSPNPRAGEAGPRAKAKKRKGT